MSFLRWGSDRRYFGGQSESYVYPTVYGGVQFEPGYNMPTRDFWEMVLRAISHTDLDDESYDVVVKEVKAHVAAMTIDEDRDETVTADEVYEAIGEIGPANVGELAEHLNAQHMAVATAMFEIDDIELVDGGWAHE